VKNAVCSKLDLTVRSSYFGIFIEINHDGNMIERFIDDNEFIMDVISKIEIEKELINK
jgi:hypothetical protein